VRRLLVICRHRHDRHLRQAIYDHLHVLDGGPERVIYHNSFTDPPRAVRGLEFDGVLLHTTFLCERWSPDFEDVRRRYAWIADLTCTKVALPQDEYDHSAVLDEWLAELGVGEVFTVLGDEVRPVLYPTLEGSARFHHALTGYIDEAMAERCAAKMRPLGARPTDVVYRATNLPYWFGSHGQIKHRVAEVVGEHATARGLVTDISTLPKDRMFGGAWEDFLLSGRTVVGAESGSSVLDRRGEVRNRVRSLLAEQPDMSFEDVAREMPEGWDSWSFFALSPRHLEAVVTRTAQVLVEGIYSGVLQPERHYLPLKRDLSNVDEVLGRLNETSALQALADRTYEEIYVGGNYRYGDFASAIRRALETGGGHVRPARKQAFAKAAAVNRVSAAPLVALRRVELFLRACARVLLGRPAPLE
jgi:hypothetical protein